MQERLVDCSEKFKSIWSQVRCQVLGNEALKQVSDAISGDGVHPDHDQRKDPALLAKNVRKRVEAC